jgi:hypothetical protein
VGIHFKGDNMKKLILIILIFLNGCYTQRDRCIEKAREKSDSPCFLAFSIIENRNRREQRGEPTSTQTRQLGDFYLIQCLSFHLEERNCENKSEIIPEIGY